MPTEEDDVSARTAAALEGLEEAIATLAELSARKNDNKNLLGLISAIQNLKISANTPITVPAASVTNVLPEMQPVFNIPSWSSIELVPRRNLRSGELESWLVTKVS